MTLTRPTLRRLLSSGALCAAFGALTIATAVPANASSLVWGNAQAWVADGDAVSGHSTAISRDGDGEDGADSGEVSGPLAGHARLQGHSHTLVDGDGAHADSTVESASFSLEAEDLVALGMIEVSGGGDGDSGDGPDGGDGEDGEGGGLSAPEDQAAPEQDGEPGNGADAREPERTPSQETPPHGDGEQDDEDDGADENERGETGGDGEHEDCDSEESPFRGPSGSGEEPGGEPVTQGSTGAEQGSGGTVEPAQQGQARAMPSAGTSTPDRGVEAVEFTVADVSTSVTAGFDGRTRTEFDHGEITVFGEPLEELGRGEEGTSVANTLEVPGEDGAVHEVPVSVSFIVNETAFEDEDPDWEGAGARSWLTVWVQVGAPENDNGFAVDLADSWALGSTHGSGADSDPGPEDKDGTAAVDERPVSRLPTTGGSLVALVAAACVALGGGAAAIYLARGRTTALDDRIED